MTAGIPDHGASARSAAPGRTHVTSGAAPGVAAGIVIGALATGMLLGLPAGRASAQTAVRIATWNMQDVGAPGSASYNAALAILNRIRPDTLSINEVNPISGGDAQALANFLSLAGDAGYPHTIFPATNPLGTLRNAFMSKFPIITSTIHTAAELSGDASANDITRLIIEATVDVPGDAVPLTLIGEHWKASSGNNNEFRRAVESIRVAQTVSGPGAACPAFVLAGDMNDVIDTVPHQPDPFVALPPGLPGSFHLGADLVAELAGPGIVNNPFFYLESDAWAGATVLDALQLDGDDTTHPATNRRIDYVFLSPAMLTFAPHAEVYDSADEGLPGGLPKFGSPLPPGTSATASDHLLVFADVTVPPAGTATDLDGDCDVDGADYAMFQMCFTGPGTTPAPGCAAADMNGDGAVDMTDFIMLQLAFTGPP